MSEVGNLLALNVAQQSARRAPWVWLALTLSLLLCATSAFFLWKTTQQWRSANEDLQNAYAMKAQREAERKKLQKERRSPDSQARERDLRRVKEIAGLSWEGLFEAIEIAAHRVRGGVSLVSMTPSTVNASSGQVHIAALASNSGVMLFYIDELKKDPRISRVELVQQQPEEKPATGVVRFQLEVQWDPSSDLPPSKKPVATGVPRGGQK